MMTKQYSMSCCKYIGDGKVNKVGTEASSETVISENSAEATDGSETSSAAKYYA